MITGNVENSNRIRKNIQQNCQMETMQQWIKFHFVAKSKRKSLLLCTLRKIVVKPYRHIESRTWSI